MKVTKENGLISIEGLTEIEVEVLMIAVLNGAESRKSCEEPSRILRRLAMQIDNTLPNNTQPITKEPPTQLDDNNLFVKRLNKVN